MANVLLVDDEPDFVAAAKEMLQLHGHTVESAERLDVARRLLGGSVPDVLLLDLMLPDGNGLELLDELRNSPVKRVVFITGHPGIKSLIKNLSGPSVSYLTKPIGSTELLRTVETDADTDNASATATASGNLHFGCLIGESPAMLAVYEQIEKVGRTPSPVLILGETGTGKELFGHEKGSFTGAVRRHPGFFKRADGATLFLDELAEMPIELQPHFLRVLETGSVLPVGSEREVPVDARIVAATNRDPKKAIADKALREDLYYRLSVFPITLPPLRARIQDVPLLVDHFLSQAQTAGAEGRRFSAEDAARLRAYHWPGNVRELRHVVLRAAIMSDPNDSTLRLPQGFDSPLNEPNGQQGLAIGRSIRDVERELIMRTLEHLNGDKRAAAETLGISLNTLYNRLNAYEAAGVGAPAAPSAP